MIRRRVLAPLLIAVIAVISMLGFLAFTVNTDTEVTVGTAAPGTTSYVTALELKKGLERKGFEVGIVATEQTLDLIELLADPNSPIDITFISDEVDANAYPRVNSLGTIARQPLLFATFPNARDVTTLSEARGRRIDVGPKGSVRASFAEQVLGEFGVTAQNSTILHLPALANSKDYREANVEILTTRWDDPRGFIDDDLVSGRLRLIPLPEAQALAGYIRSAEAVDVPLGALRLTPPAPAAPVPAIAQLATVVGSDSLSPAAIYAVAEVLVDEFSPGTMYSQPGEFPNFADRQLPINPYAADYYDTGNVPWQYKNLPPILADSFVSLIVLGTILLLAASVYSLFLPEVYSLWTGVIKPRSAERSIAEIESALAEGRELTLRQRMRLSEILAQQDAGRVLRQRAEALRVQLSAPIDDETDNDVDPSSGDVLGERRAPQTPSDR